MTLEPHQLTDDLRIGLSAKRMIVRSGPAKDLDERAMNGAFPRTVGEENGSVDVEEHELHERVRRRPDMIDIAPTICHGVGVSCRSAQAISRAMTGWRLEYI